MNAPDFAHDARLSPSARLVGEELHRITRRCYSDCLVATGTIARRLGLSVRTVQSALRALAHLGLVEVIRDYGLRTRRRIRLLWRALTVLPKVTREPLSAPDSSVNADMTVECQAEFAFTDASPPDPPIKVSEDNTEGGRTDEAAAGDPACGHPAPGEAESSSSPPKRSLPPEDEEPEPEEVAAAVQEAIPVLGAGPAAEGRVRAWARHWNPSWVRKALGITAAKGDTVQDPVRYTAGVLAKFATEGGPIESTARIATPEEEEAAWAFILGPRTPCPGAGP